MATGRTIIKRALRLLNVISQGDSVDGDAKETNAFEALNSLLAFWGSEKLLVPYIIQENKTLSIGTNTYTIGSSGDINSTRPIKVVDAWIRDSSNNDYPLEIISKNYYNEQALKTMQGRPSMLEYSPEYTLGKIRLYPTPSAAETLYIDSWKPLTAISAVTDTINFPPMYEEALVYNLAINIAPEYDKAIPDVVGLRAREGKDFIKGTNAPQVPFAKIDDGLLYSFSPSV